MNVPDVVRARIFLRHLKDWENGGDMPNLVMIQLPSDHTQGTTPDFSTPKACLADNDLAVGQIVEGISHSRFWKSTLILIVEDDAQDGLDHVDGHRTVALAVSPYIKRGSIDDTFYSQVSMVKTIEMILGVPPMSIFDMIANDMRASFQSTPDLTPYEAVRTGAVDLRTQPQRECARRTEKAGRHCFQQDGLARTGRCSHRRAQSDSVAQCHEHGISNLETRLGSVSLRGNAISPQPNPNGKWFRDVDRGTTLFTSVLRFAQATAQLWIISQTRRA